MRFGFSRQDSVVRHAPRAVHIDRAAFQNHSAIVNGKIERRAHACWHDIIQIEWRILAAPGVVTPIDNRQLRILLARQENRTVIAAPRFVGWNFVIGNALVRQTFQDIARFRFVRAVADIDADRLRFDQRRDHFAKGRHDAVERVGKTDAFTPRP